MVQIAYARRPLARKNTPVQLTALGAEEFEGYASLFDRPDGVGDVVAPGAFAASLRRRGADDVRMLYQHFAHAPIGVWDEIREDARGLYVRGHLVRDVEQARDVRALLEAGALNGLSIGFRTIRAQRMAGGRVLSGHTSAYLRIQTSAGLSGVRMELNPASFVAPSEGSLFGNCALKLTAGDTVKVIINLSGSSKVVDVYGAALGSVMYSNFQGFLIAG